MPVGIFNSSSSSLDSAQNVYPPGFIDGQTEFAKALLDPDRPIPSGLIGPDGLPSARRFAVYRNNVVVGLIETLKAAFPVVHRLVGNEFFGAMARIFVMEQPPTSPIILDYGAGFAGFIGRFEPAAVVPYLQDIARLERAWIESYHSAEALPLTSSDLSQIPPGELPELQLVLHPSVRIVRSKFPIVGIWQANVGDNEAGYIDFNQRADEALIARPEADVEVRTLPAGAAAFIEALQAGLSIADALKDGLSASPRFDLAAALTGMIEAGVIVGSGLPPVQRVEVA